MYESGEPALIPFRCNSVGILSDASVCTKPSPSSSSSPSSLAAYGSAVCGSGLWDKDKDVHLSPSSRVVLDINGLPVVMRSKSMSTGSSGSLVHGQQHPQHPQQLAVMVPVSNSSAASGHKRQNKTPAVNAYPLASSSSSSSSSPAHAACPDVRKDSGGKSASLEAAVKSFCVRSFFRDKVSSARTEAKCSSSSTQMAVIPAQSPLPPVNVGVDNAAFESSCGQVSVSLSDGRFRQHKHKHPDQSAAGRSSAPKPPETCHRPVRQQSTASSNPAASASPSSCTRCRKSQHPPPPSLTGSDSNSSSSKLASLHVVSCLTFNHGEAPKSSQT